MNTAPSALIKCKAKGISWGFILFWTLISNPVFADSEKLVILTTFSKPLLLPLLNEFNQRHPDTTVQLLYRRTSSIRHLLDQPFIQDVDLLLSSSPFLMKGISERNHLKKLPRKLQTPEWLEPYTLVENEKVTTFAYSGGGLIINTDYLKSHNLSRPDSWKDLTKPEYFGHLAASTPGRSGTNQLMIESLLQLYGWDDGWQLILNMGANLATISSRSFGVSDGVAQGNVAAGAVIDSYAIRLRKKLDHIDYVALSEFTLMPTYIGMVKTSKNTTSAENFIRFLLSDPVQESLIEKALTKHSMKDSTLAKLPHTKLIPESTYNRELAIQILFDLSVTRQLPDLSETWLSIINAEQKFLDSELNLRRIKKAKQLAFEMPVSEEEALHLLNKANLKQYSNLTRLEQDQAILEVLRLWRGRLENNLKQANQIIRSLPEYAGANGG